MELSEYQERHYKDNSIDIHIFRRLSTHFVWHFARSYAVGKQTDRLICIPVRAHARTYHVALITHVIRVRHVGSRIRNFSSNLWR